MESTAQNMSTRSYARLDETPYLSDEDGPRRRSLVTQRAASAGRRDPFSRESRRCYLQFDWSGASDASEILTGSRYPVIKGKPEFPSPGTSLLGVNPHGKGWNCLVAFSHRLTDSLNEERVMPTEPLDGESDDARGAKSDEANSKIEIERSFEESVALSKRKSRFDIARIEKRRLKSLRRMIDGAAADSNDPNDD